MRSVTRGFFCLFAPVAACAGDPGEFHPAKSAPDKAPANDAYRIKNVAPECELLGTVTAEGEDDLAVERIGKTAARHGANRFVVQEDERDRRLHRDMHGNVSPTTNHRMVAEVYRCPDNVQK